MEIERARGGIAILRMKEGRANAIGPAFLEALDRRLGELGEARAVVLVGDGRVFSAGFDLPSLFDLDRPAIEAFVGRFSEVALRLFELPVPVVAAVEGHAIAGGCALAMLADQRIAADRDAKIGLSEVALGIGLPAVVLETLRFRVPPGSLVKIALEGALVGPREALALGLVDEVVPDGAALDAALLRAHALGSVPAAAFAQVKALVRAPTASAVRAQRAVDASRWADTWFSAEARERLGAAVARLRHRT